MATDADVLLKLGALEFGSVAEALDYMGYRAAAKRELAADGDRSGHESYAEDLRRDAELLELAVLVCKSTAP